MDMPSEGIYTPFPISLSVEINDPEVHHEPVSPGSRAKSSFTLTIYVGAH